MRMKAGLNYILDGHTPIVEDDVIKWSVWFGETDRRVDETIVGNVYISTVFLGIDHNFDEKDKPMIFETMICGGKHDEYQTRCSTWDEAVVMHEKAVALVK